MEKLINADLCIMCSQNCTENRYSLTMTLDFSQKPIISLIEEFTATFFAEEVINEAGMCTDCVTRFVEYDNHLAAAQNIQNEITNLFFTETNHPVEEEHLHLVKEDESLVYDSEIVSDIPDESQEFLVQVKKPIKFDYQCEICDRSFKEKTKLKAHRLIHTEERNVICSLCFKSFKTPACLRAHKRVHNRISIECDFCGKSYSQKSELLKHINFVHFNRRDYQCQYCSASFGSRGHLVAHYQTHDRQKAFSCSVCGYSFHTPSKLERHMRTHTGKRDFACEICGKRFLHSYNVNAHIKHVHWKIKRKADEERCTCKICGKRFQRKDKLIIHFRDEHKDMETNEGFVVEEIDFENNIEFVEIIS